MMQLSVIQFKKSEIIKCAVFQTIAEIKSQQHYLYFCLFCVAVCLTFSLFRLRLYVSCYLFFLRLFVCSFSTKNSIINRYLRDLPFFPVSTVNFVHVNGFFSLVLFEHHQNNHLILVGQSVELACKLPNAAHSLYSFIDSRLHCMMFAFYTFDHLYSVHTHRICMCFCVCWCICVVYVSVHELNTA